jgi:hypothetical protein
MVSAADRATGPDRGRLGGPPDTGECHYFRMPADRLSPEAGSPADSPVGFSRLPGTLGTVASDESGTQHF